jgi:hypothetical protein
MKSKLMAGALAASLFGGGLAFAGDDKDCPPGEKQSMQTEEETQSLGTSEQPQTDEAFGGSGEQGMTQEPGVTQQQPTTQTQPAYVAPVVVKTDDDDVKAEEEANKNDMRGLTVLLGGGVEGYTGDLAPAVEPGAAYGVTAAIKPTRVLGIEFGYSGAVNNLRDDAGDGADLVRNGGQAALTLGLSSTAVQPYVLGGIGLNHYDVRGASNAQGFRDDTSAYIPLGLGLRTHIGDFTADARGTWSALVNEDFSTAGEQDVIGLDVSGTGRFGGMIQIGATF